MGNDLQRKQTDETEITEKVQETLRILLYTLITPDFQQIYQLKTLISNLKQPTNIGTTILP